jgi:hypothetical protein
VQLTVAQAFEAEKSKLMALPMDGYPVDARIKGLAARLDRTLTTPSLPTNIDDGDVPF